MVRRRLVVGLLMLALLGIGGVSRWNPLAVAGANNQLESRCSADPVATSVYDHSSWTPLRWSCTVTRADGTAVVIRPDLW